MAAKEIVKHAYENGSIDNLTVQILRIESLLEERHSLYFLSLAQLPFPPLLDERMEFDGFNIVRKLHASNRSHVFLVRHMESNNLAVLKTPSVDLRNETGYLEHFIMEEWIANKIDSPHTMRPFRGIQKRGYLYTVNEYIDGQTLLDWMKENPRSDFPVVSDIVAQIAKGLRAMHRMEMLHQDIRPNNIMIGHDGIVKIIDFGSTYAAGMDESVSNAQYNLLPGTAQYMAPEYFLGESGNVTSDLFSLAVICYQMLSGKLPYGTELAKTRSRAAQARLVYNTVLDDERDIPSWVDDVLRKALHPDPHRRYSELSEFLYDLSHPRNSLLLKSRPPLLESNPALFWKSVSLTLVTILLAFVLEHGWS